MEIKTLLQVSLVLFAVVVAFGTWWELKRLEQEHQRLDEWERSVEEYLASRRMFTTEELDEIYEIGDEEGDNSND